MVGLWLDNCSPALRACWHPVALGAEIADAPVGVELLGERWVLTRLDGQLVAFADRCPHRGAPLSAGCVDGPHLRCAYHGWGFGPDGRCRDIPALGPGAPIPGRATLTAGLVAERAGLVWLAPEPPLAPMPELPAIEDASRQVLVTDWRAGAAQMMDNFLDVGHFAFSHRHSFGVAEDAASVDMEVARDGWSFTVAHHHLARLVDSDEWAAGVAPPRPRTERFRYDAPFAMRLDLSYEDVDDRVTLLFFVQPVDRERSRLYSMALRNPVAAARCSPEEGYRRGMQIIDEDRDLLELMATPALDLDPMAEVHTRADRNTLALRRVLADLVAAHAEQRATPETAPAGAPTEV